jgi:hypothetical protein
VTPERHGGEIERAEPESEHHCSPVLRPYAVMTGDSERRRVAPSAAPRLRWACLKRIFRRDNEREA